MVGKAEEPGASCQLFAPSDLRALAFVWSNLSKDQLMAAGVIGPGVGGTDWRRFNDGPMEFILKLPPKQLAALCKLLD